MKNDVVILTGRSNPELAKAVGGLLQLPVDKPVSLFSDGEIRVRIAPNLRQKKVFILQSTSTPVNDYVMELLFMIDAAKRASAAEITVVLPYYGYARQDRKEMARVPISASVVASMLSHAGADRIVTFDIHSEQQLGFIQKPWDNLYGSYALLPKLQEKKSSHFVVAAPDKGGMLKAAGYAKLLGAAEIAVVYKKRDIMLNNVSNTLAMIGDVQGRDVLIVDDMIDTAGTIVNAANYLKKKGANRVFVTATHGVFSGSALAKITESAIEEMIITDTIAHKEAVINHPKITIVSVSPILAEAIGHIVCGESIGKYLIL
jgi:ribose-phosphate pyrophosphokinase